MVVLLRWFSDFSEFRIFDFRDFRIDPNILILSCQTRLYGVKFGMKFRTPNISEARLYDVKKSIFFVIFSQKLTKSPHLPRRYTGPRALVEVITPNGGGQEGVGQRGVGAGNIQI